MIESLTVNPESLARELDLPFDRVAATVALLEEGRSVSFIARYRKDQTNNLDEDTIARIATAHQKRRQLNDRKLSFLMTIEAQGKLTPELEKQIREARSPKRLDDLYLPYRSKRASVAQAARDKGLEPLATAILDATDASKALEELAAASVAADKGVATVQEALDGAADIIAEKFSETLELRRIVRDAILRTGKLVSKKAERPETEEPAPEPVASEPKAEETASSVTESISAEETVGGEPAASDVGEDAPAPQSAEAPAAVDSETTSSESAPSEPVAQVAEEEKKTKKPSVDRRQERNEQRFEEYFDASFPIRNCPESRIFALNRGESLGVLSVDLDVDEESLKKSARELLVAPDRPYADFLNAVVDSAVANLALPALKADARRDATERAEERAAAGMAKNLRSWLMRKPLANRRVLAIAPGMKSGSKLVALDENGALLSYEAVFTQGSAERKANASAKIVEMIENFGLSVIAIGNGLGSRDVENFVSKLLEEKFADKDVAYIVVNDAGASAYGASQAAKEEFPDCDATVRAAISIGRRTLDPLKELVKMEPERLATGAHQRDVHFKTVKTVLSAVLSACVDKVGVDPNLADLATLRRVSGLNQLTAKRVADYRVENGPFQTREQIKSVRDLGDLAYSLCAGFFKIPNGPNPLDATWIHPESYELATKLLEKMGFALDDLRDASKREDIAAKVADADAKALAEEFGAGAFTVADILEQFVAPGSDPREKEPGPIFKKGAIKLESLQPGMELSGVVLNVVEFGAFVDVGATESGLIHISQLGSSYVRDAAKCVAVGDVLKVWVLKVEPERHRLSLTALPPGTSRERRADAGPRGRRAEGDERRNRERRPNRDAAKGSERSAERPDAKRREPGERPDRPRRDRNRDRDDRAQRPPRSASVAPKDKKIVPLSEEMKSGKEPMRSFSDLAQLFGRIQPTDDAEKQ